MVRTMLALERDRKSETISGNHADSHGRDVVQEIRQLSGLLLYSHYRYASIEALNAISHSAI